jgi:hypothetical protein
VQLPTSGPSAGKIQLTYDAFGVPGPTTDILVDVVAYTSSLGIADLAARVNTLEATVAGANNKVVQLEKKVVDSSTAIAALNAQLATKQDACADGTVIAWGRVTATPGEDWVPLSAMTSCTGAALQVRQVDAADPDQAGVYELRMDGYLLDPTAMQFTSNGDQSRIAGFMGSSTEPSQSVLVQVRDSRDGVKTFSSFQVAVHSVVPAS